MILRKPRAKKRNQRGQGLIEFVLVISVMLTLLFMFVQLSFGIALGHYIQYATFLSSRALLASRATATEQQDAARQVLEQFIKNRNGGDVMSFLAKPRQGEERDIQSAAEPMPGAFIGAHPYAQKAGMNSRSYGWAEGVQYNFDVKLFLFPLASWLAKSRSKSIDMGNSDNPAPPVEWKGMLPFTSESWLGREESFSECQKRMQDLSHNAGINRVLNEDFLYDNGC